jgi:two-component SAPR family response regulator
MLARLARCLEIEPYVRMDELRDSEASPTVIVVEDVQVILSGFVRMLGEELPDAEVCGFSSSAEALDFARVCHVSVAFLDIELAGDDGITLARELTKLDPYINIIFLTSHTEYMHAALTDHCSGYVLKPLTPEKIRHEIAHLRFPVRGLKP